MKRTRFSDKISLPMVKIGRPSALDKEIYQRQTEQFCDHMKELNSRLDFSMSARGWCYYLEGKGVIDKGEFGRAERIINQCRKNGMLPVDICSEHEPRIAMLFQEDVEKHEEDPETFAEYAMHEISPPRFESYRQYVNRYYRYLNDYADDCASLYNPYTLQDFQDNYIEMMVEKVDLVGIFQPLCRKYNIPLANNVGWKDINSRYYMMQRFRDMEAEGKQPVLLYFGDLDPGGGLIAKNVRKNLDDISEAVEWRPDNLLIDVFGLKEDFVLEYGLSWINNLKTGSGGEIAVLRPDGTIAPGRTKEGKRHPDFDKPHVQQWLSKYGVRKVEANALVANIELGRQLCEDAILRYYDTEAEDELDKATEKERDKASDIIQDLIQTQGFEPDEENDTED